MSTWLLDTPVFKTLGTPKAKPLSEWCEVNDVSLFLSTASLAEVALALNKLRSPDSQRGQALRLWLEAVTTRFANRIHPVDTAIAIRAGAILPFVANGLPRHRLHDALLVATAQAHGHGLITRREAVFGPWTKTPIKAF